MSPVFLFLFFFFFKQKTAYELRISDWSSDVCSSDLIVKSKYLAGFDAPYVPGWDCHGLPIEIAIEKKYGKVGVKLDAVEFRQKCREYANAQIDIQRKDFKRLGVIGDWEHPYRSLDFRFEADEMRALAKVIDNGHLVRGVKPVYWCFDCGSALAERSEEHTSELQSLMRHSYAVLCLTTKI